MLIPRSRHFLAAALAALAAVSSACRTEAQAPPSAPKTEPCRPPGVQDEARCGTLEVWENRATRTGRKIPIRFAVLPATGPDRKPDAIVPLSGGPGQSAVEEAGAWARQLAAARRERDLLLVDQRGTGGSNPLECEMYGPPDDPASYTGAFYPAEAVARCAAALAGRADVTQYASAPAADDLEEVRAALGYPKVNLFGASYGTRAAQTYLRRHPERVRSVVLLGVVPNDTRMPVHAARDAQRAIEGVFAECAAQPSCAAAFPDLPGSLRRAVERLERAPAPVEVTNPATGAPARISLSRDLFGEAVRYMLYSAGNAAMVPAVVHQAGRGDYGAVAEFALSARRRIVGGGSAGTYLAVLCAEDVAFIEPGEGERLAAGTFLGGYRVRDQKAACARWPHVPADRSFLQPVRSDVPALVLSGQWDPATPPEQGERVARHLSRSRHVVIPGGAHGFVGLINGGRCPDALIAAFIADPDPAALDVSCVATVRRRPFPTGALETRTIAVAAAWLAQLAGVYRGDGMEVRVAVENGALKLHAPDRSFTLEPVAPGRFRARGAPFLYVVFVREGGAVKGMRVEQAGVLNPLLARVS